MIKIKINLIIIIMITSVNPLFPVDTTENFAVGVFTDFEMYYSAGFGAGGMGHSAEVLIGGGFIKTLSYTVTTGIAHNGGETEIALPGIGLIWNPITLKGFAMDLIPTFNFDPNITKGTITYSDFRAFTAGIDLEFNLTVFEAFQPFLLAGFGYSYDYPSGNTSWATPLALGAMVSVKEGIEFLFQLGWTPGQDIVWVDAERAIGIGFNIMAADNLEVITEIAWESTKREFSVSIGLICCR